MTARKRVKLGDSTKANGPFVATTTKTDQSAGQLTKGKKSKKLGKLARILDVPLEVFTEIASYVSPNDLLQLARSSKALRAILMSKNSMHVWEAARASMGIPDLKWLSEPHYADLLFSKRCRGEECNNRRATKVSFALGIQFCRICLEKETLDSIAMRKKCFFEVDIWPEITGRGLLPSFDTKDGKDRNKRFLSSSVSSFIERIKQCQSAAEKVKVIEDVTADTERRNEAAAPVERWTAHEARLKSDANATLRTARRKSIEERLVAMGYSREDFDTTYDKEEWKWGTLLDQPRLLTETIWNKILPQLEETLRLRITEARPLRRKALVSSIESFFRIIWKKRQPADEIGSIHPTALYKLFPDFQAMLDDPERRDCVSFHLWASLEERFDDAIDSLVKEIESDCAVTMEASYRLQGQATEGGTVDGLATTEDGISPILLRATSFFEYDGKLMSYAGILKLRAATDVDRRPERWPKDKLGVEVPEGAIGFAGGLLRNMSLKEDESMVRLERLGKAFSCHRCQRCEAILIEDLSWAELVQHFLTKNKEHHDRMRNRSKLGIDVPLRNEHNVVDDAKGINFAYIVSSAEQRYRTSMNSLNNENSYSRLSKYKLYEWGYNSSIKSYHYAGEYDRDYETDEEIPVWKHGELDDWSCKLCAALKLDDFEARCSDAVELAKHMKRIHGTDFDGVPLAAK